MKKFTCILLSLLIFATPIMASEIENSCEDKLYLELNNKKLSDMTDREYEYYMQKDKACEEWKAKLLTVNLEKEKQDNLHKQIIYKTYWVGLVGILFMYFYFNI